jgi:hypothetical protein
MAGTLWCADALFAFAAAGAAGFHFHWGFGGRPQLGGQPNTGVQTNWFKNADSKPYPSVHAPWYGYLLFRLATAGASNGFSDATIVSSGGRGGGCQANVKVWGLVADGGALRVAVLNKDAYTPCNVLLSVDALYCGGAATVSRLMPGARGMDSKDGIRWRGQTYDNVANGVISGAAADDLVPTSKVEGGRCTVIVPMPVASAAVMEAQSSATLPLA